MFKHLIFAILLFANVAYASEGDMIVDNKLKRIHMLSAYGVMCDCDVPLYSDSYRLTGAEYSWNYFIFKKISVGLSYNLLAYDSPHRLPAITEHNPSLSTLGLNIGYYLGNKKSIVVPHLSIEGRFPGGNNSPAPSGLLLNYCAGSLIKLRKNVYMDFTGSKMSKNNYSYFFVKLGLSSMIY